MLFLTLLLLVSLSPEWKDMTETPHLRVECFKVFHSLYIVCGFCIYSTMLRRKFHWSMSITGKNSHLLTLIVKLRKVMFAQHYFQNYFQSLYTWVLYQSNVLGYTDSSCKSWAWAASHGFIKTFSSTWCMLCIMPNSNECDICPILKIPRDIRKPEWMSSPQPCAWHVHI